MALLEPYGVSSEDFAWIMRDPDDEDYPSGGLVRTMRNRKKQQEPSERFCDLFYQAYTPLMELLQANDAERVIALLRGRGLRANGAAPYDVLDRFLVIRLPKDVEITVADLSDWQQGRRFGVGVPEQFIRQCVHCGRSFFGYPWSRYHDARCRRAAAKERRDGMGQA